MKDATPPVRLPVMTRRVITVLEDDFDSGPADETIRFGLDGTTYEIDLSSVHAKQLRVALAVWVEHARRDRKGPQMPRRVSTQVDPRAVRAWANARGITVPARGRIPLAVVEQFQKAGN